MYLQINTQSATLSSYCDNPLVRALIISLFSWRRANPDDDVDDVMGWWADTYNQDGDLTGSRLWELLRQKITQTALAAAEEYCREALEWLVTDGVASEVTAAAERSGFDQVDIVVTVQQPGRDQTSIRFQNVWRKI
jgi:phage gp46-like protein